MRISEVHITRYGPLRDFHLNLDTNMELVYGPNESGKTLIVDAILKLLLGKAARKYSDIDRVEEHPEGYIVMEIDGQQIKLERRDTLQSILIENPECNMIEADELRNIFVVRDSDLQIEQSSSFYGNLTERLSGTKSSEIKIIIDELRKEGQLTPTGNIIDKQDTGYTKRRLNQARLLRHELTDYQREASQNNRDKLEAELFKLKAKIHQLDNQITELKKAKHWFRIEENSEILLRVQEHMNQLAHWDKDAIDNIQYQIRKINEQDDNQSSLEWNRHILLRLSALCLIISPFSVALANWIPGFSILGLLPFVGLVVVAILFAIGAAIANQKVTRLKSEQSKAISNGRKMGIDCATIEELDFELNEALKPMSSLNEIMHQEWGVLKRNLDLKSKSPEKGLEEATAKIELMKKEVEPTDTRGYTEEKLDKSVEELSGEKDFISEKEKSLEDHRGRLSQFEKTFSGLRVDEYITHKSDIIIDNLASIERAIPILDEFANTIEENAKKAKLAIGIFNDILDEEKMRISDLFEEDGVAAKTFSDITDGRYSGILYDQKNETLKVLRPDGEKLPAKMLSKGATDQLYLSVRLALAQKLISDQRCFFLFDDAMMSSDKNRLENQAGFLTKLAAEGWQVIYFTSKDDTFRTIRKLASAKLTKLNQLP